MCNWSKKNEAQKRVEAMRNGYYGEVIDFNSGSVEQIFEKQVEIMLRWLSSNTEEDKRLARKFLLHTLPNAVQISPHIKDGNKQKICETLSLLSKEYRLPNNEELAYLETACLTSAVTYVRTRKNYLPASEKPQPMGCLSIVIFFICLTDFLC